MSDPEQPPLNDLLSNFALGPAWARGEDEKRGSHSGGGKGGRKDGGSKGSRGNFRDQDRQGGRRREQGGKFKGKRPFQKGGKFDRLQDNPPADGVRVTILPDTEAVHLIVKEVHQVARVYPLFDIATTLLSKRERCHAVFERKESLPAMWRSKKSDALFLSKEDAQAHLWHSEARAQHLEEETIEVEPPKGNFQAVAKCGLSGKWLGPPNFHTYQTDLRRLHQQRFANMPFEAYAAKVRTEHGEEAVNAWLETMTKKTRWRVVGEEGDDAWMDDPLMAQRKLASIAFEGAYEQTHKAELPASVTGHQLSAPLRISLKLAFNHARKHAAMLIPAICKALESDHLPVFKRKGKLYTGPVRPHPLPKDATLAPRPAQMVEWIRANTPGAKLEGLWKAVLPEGATAPSADYAADLFWLLQQGHILLFTDDTLVVQEVRPPQEPKKKAAKKAAKKEAKEDARVEKQALKEEKPATDPAGTDLKVGMSAEDAAKLDSFTPKPPAAAVEKPMNEPEKVDRPPEAPTGKASSEEGEKPKD
ncbi:MAG: hypothetical protein R3242_11130 [Akkermansiaceae bacterium]|nr:hypothetical protein [Akkermansiaceae bacterium]